MKKDRQGEWSRRNRRHRTGPWKKLSRKGARLTGFPGPWYCSAVQIVENGPQLRSRLNKILNVPRGYASGFVSPAALLDARFEQSVLPGFKKER